MLASIKLTFLLILIIFFSFGCGGNEKKYSPIALVDSAEVVTNTVTDANEDILGMYHGVQPAYNLKNQYGDDMEINGNKVPVSSIDYKFIIKENGAVTLQQTSITDQTRVYYDGTFKVLDKIGNTVKIECSLNDGNGSTPTYILIFDKSDNTARCIGNKEPTFTLEKQLTETDESAGTTIEESNISTQESEASHNINGTYTYKDDSAELEITVRENTWTGKTRIITGMGEEYDKIEYESGVVKGNELFESSGYVKIGYISGNSLTTTIGGSQVVLRK